MRWAIMAVDPGGTTGVAKLYLNPGVLGRPRTVERLVQRAVARDAYHYGEVKGSPKEQAYQLVQMWMDTIRYARETEAVPYLVMESFQLRQRNADLSPVAVIHGVEAIMWAACTSPGAEPWLWDAVKPIYLTPSERTWVTNKRLRALGAWAVGSEHARDATRHAIALASRLLDA